MISCSLARHPFSLHLSSLPIIMDTTNWESLVRENMLLVDVFLVERPDLSDEAWIFKQYGKDCLQRLDALAAPTLNLQVDIRCWSMAVSSYATKNLGIVPSAALQDLATQRGAWAVPTSLHYNTLTPGMCLSGLIV